MHTILGAGGPVSNALQKELQLLNIPVRLVSRRKIEASQNVSWQGADLLVRQQVLDATKGSSVMYMCAGLRYDNNIWQAQWPVIMNNIIDAAKANNARLIFFDNVYMYGRVDGAMTERSPCRPSSAKGKVRAAAAEQLLGEMKAGNIRASIARAADFYGAQSLISFFDSMVLEKYSKKSKAMWLGNIHSKHSFTYIPDAGKAVALLGTNPESDNQTWHLPTAEALSGLEFIRLAADVFQTRPSYMKVNKFMLNIIGIFNKLIGETSEMYYQYQYDYIFDSRKFEDYFHVRPTSYEDGIAELSRNMFGNKPTVINEARQH